MRFSASVTRVLSTRRSEEKKDEKRNALDDRPPKPRLDNLALGRHRKDNRESKLVVPGVEGAQLLRERRRKHRHGALNEVDRRGALAGFAVERGVGLYVLAHTKFFPRQLPVREKKGKGRKRRKVRSKRTLTK